MRNNWLKYLSRKTKYRNISYIIEEASMPQYHQTLPKLKRELSRVRRFQRSLSIAVIRQNGHFHTSSQKEIDVEASYDFRPISQIEFLLCGLIVRNSIREIDIPAYDEKNNQFIFFLPETSTDQAIQTMKRIRKIIGKRIADQLSFGIADLLQHAMDLCSNGSFHCLDEHPAAT